MLEGGGLFTRDLVAGIAMAVHDPDAVVEQAWDVAVEVNSPLTREKAKKNEEKNAELATFFTETVMTNPREASKQFTYYSLTTVSSVYGAGSTVRALNAMKLPTVQLPRHLRDLIVHQRSL